MSAMEISKKDEEKQSILNAMKAIRGQIVDVEILSKSQYNDATPLMVKDKIQQLKQNIFDLDISITNRLV